MEFFGLARRMLARGSGESPGTQHLELVPGRLTATVVDHDLDGRHRRTISSGGLEAHGQAEVAITLLRGDQDAVWLSDVTGFFTTLLDLAAQGRVVGPWGYTLFQLAGGRDFLAPGVRGVMYLPAVPGATGPAPPGVLHLQVLVGDAEGQMAWHYSALRVATRLGGAFSYYPWPGWCEPTRASVFSASQVTSTMMRTLPLHMVPGVTAVLEDNRFTLRIPAAQAGAVAALVHEPFDAALGLRLDWDPTADAWFIWQEGQTGPTAISPPGSQGRRIGLTFLAVAPGTRPDQVLLVEDGGAVILGEASASAFAAAIRAAEPWSVQPEGYGFAVEFPAPPPPAADPLELAVRLYLPAPELQRRLGEYGQPLAEYVQRLRATVWEEWSAVTDGDAAGLLVAIGVKPSGEARAWCDSVGGVARVDALRRLEAALAAQPPLTPSGGPIAFGLQLRLPGCPLDAVPVFPSAWFEAADGHARRLQIPDELFAHIWP